MAASERLLGCVLAALLGGCTLITSADDHKDGTGADMGQTDMAMADAGDDDLGVDDMGQPDDMGPPDMTRPPDMPVDMFVDGGTEFCSGVGDLNGGSLVASGLDAYDVTDFTIELWYRPTTAALSSDQNLFGRWGVLNTSGSYGLYINDGRPALALSCFGDDFASFDSSFDLTADTWVHIAATFNASTRRVRIFVNGVTVADRTAGCGPPTTLGTGADLVLGYDDPVGGDPAQGLVDEARLSNVVRYVMDFTPALTFATDADTLALYHFEDDGLPAADDSANDNEMSGAGAAGLAMACRPLMVE